MEARHYQHFSDLVRALRGARALSQRQLAKALGVSSGYIGQWELRLSQPAAEVVERLCRIFQIDDVEYVQRLAYAERAPEWLKESIISYERDPQAPRVLTAVERRVLDAVGRLPEAEAARLAERIEGWVEAISSRVDGD
jgi:transcriptional regulator with XRE-family HTH domain